MLTQRALDMLESPLGKYRGFWLQAWCGSPARVCRHIANVQITDLQARYGEVLLADVVRRIRCGKCGAMPLRVAMRHHMICEWLIGEEPP